MQLKELGYAEQAAALSPQRADNYEAQEARLQPKGSRLQMKASATVQFERGANRTDPPTSVELPGGSSPTGPLISDAEKALAIGGGAVAIPLIFVAPELLFVAIGPAMSTAGMETMVRKECEKLGPEIERSLTGSYQSDIEKMLREKPKQPIYAVITVRISYIKLNYRDREVLAAVELDTAPHVSSTPIENTRLESVGNTSGVIERVELRTFSVPVSIGPKDPGAGKSQADPGEKERKTREQDHERSRLLETMHPGRDFCWVARQVIPERWTEARSYILRLAPTAFRTLYMERGEAFARFISDKPAWQNKLRPAFLFFADQSLEHDRNTVTRQQTPSHQTERSFVALISEALMFDTSE